MKYRECTLLYPIFNIRNAQKTNRLGSEKEERPIRKADFVSVSEHNPRGVQILPVYATSNLSKVQTICVVVQETDHKSFSPKNIYDGTVHTRKASIA